MEDLKYRIMVVEDDADNNRLIERLLVKEGYEVTPAYSGTEARLLFMVKEFDLLILDLMLPGLSGEELLREIRRDKNLPVLVLTAKGSMEDKVQLLEDGADDYMTKPFEARELIARVNTQLRRAAFGRRSDAGLNGTDTQRKILQVRELIIDTEAMTLMVDGEMIDVTYHEFLILKLLAEHPKKVFSKEALYENVWNNGYYGEDNTVSVHVSNIRKK